MSEDKGNDNARSRFERAYREEKPKFLAFAAKRSIDGEDILQDIFVSGLARLGELTDVTNLNAWIFRALRNRLTDLWRRRNTRVGAGEVDLGEAVIEEFLDAAGFDPLDQYVRGELYEALAEAIDALPAAQRQIIQAQVYENRSFQEISDETGVPVATLSARKRAAIRNVAAALKDWVDD